MDQKHSMLLLRCTAAAAGISAAVLIGALYPKSGSEDPFAVTDTQPVLTAAPAAAQVQQDEPDEPAEDTEINFIDYRKAGIAEYKMAAVSTKTVTVLSSKKDTSSSEAEPEPEKAPAEPFTVTLPEDGTEVYDIHPDPYGSVGTRSVRGEYYTVNDLISGGLVTMDAHEMLCRMVYNEIGGSWDTDAIKAQVVAAYTHLRYNDSIGHTPTIALKSGYPQVIEDCVSAVEGRCVLYRGSIINATYFASAAGYTADSGLILGVDYPYLKPCVSEYDSKDPNYGTQVTFTEDKVRETLEKKTGFTLSDNVQDWFTVEAMHAGRYVRTLSIDGGRARISGTDMRSIFGLKSSAFEISYANGIFTFTTYGFGHGVGMSQWGAKLYADKGWSYDQILRHYYVNTTISVTDVNSNAVARAAQYEKEKAEREKAAQEKTAQEKAEKTDSSTPEADSQPAAEDAPAEETASQPQDETQAADPQEPADSAE